MTNEQPKFTCPNCGKNWFEIGVTEHVDKVDISTKIDFNQGHINMHETELQGSDNGKSLTCNGCKYLYNINSDELDAVFTGQCTEAQMKIQCDIIDKPVYKCPECKENVLEYGIFNCFKGGVAKTKVTFMQDGMDFDTDPGDMTDYSEAWTECGSCGAVLDHVNETNLHDIYTGKLLLEDLLPKGDST